MIWSGRVLTLLVTLFLLFDGGTGLLAPQSLSAEMAATGFGAGQLPIISFIAIGAAILFAVPRTAVIGAILVTAFAGGAICTHFRVDGLGSPPQIICALLAIAAWGALWLRDARLRALSGGVAL